MATNGVPAKTDFDFNDSDFIVNVTEKGEASYYREIPAKKVNRKFNLVKSDPPKQVTKESRNRRNRRAKKESVMTPIPTYMRGRDRDFDVKTSTGNANVLVNEIAKLLDKHIDNEEVDFEIKIKADEDGTRDKYPLSNASFSV